MSKKFYANKKYPFFQNKDIFHLKNVTLESDIDKDKT